jgi:hypothetical protein
MKKGGRRAALFVSAIFLRPPPGLLGELGADRFQIDHAVSHRAPVANARRRHIGVAEQLADIPAEADDVSLAQFVAQMKFSRRWRISPRSERARWACV